DQLLQSILAALPDTPARLSRPIALRRAIDPRRTFYPPQDPGGQLLDEPALGAGPVWRQGSLLLAQGVSNLATNSHPPYGWPLVAALLASSQILTAPLPPGADPNGRRRYAAATLIPAP